MLFRARTAGRSQSGWWTVSLPLVLVSRTPRRRLVRWSDGVGTSPDCSIRTNLPIRSSLRLTSVPIRFSTNHPPTTTAVQAIELTRRSNRPESDIDAAPCDSRRSRPRGRWFETRFRWSEQYLENACLGQSAPLRSSRVSAPIATSRPVETVDVVGLRVSHLGGERWQDEHANR